MSSRLIGPFTINTCLYFSQKNLELVRTGRSYFIVKYPVRLFIFVKIILACTLILKCPIIRFFSVPRVFVLCKPFWVFKFSKDIQHLLKWTIFNALGIWNWSFPQSYIFQELKNWINPVFGQIIMAVFKIFGILVL